MMEKKLPKNWVETIFGAIVKLKNGYAFKSNDLGDEGFPIVKIGNIQDGKIDLSKATKASDKFFKDDFVIYKGDILIAMSGATTGKYGVYEADEIILQNQRVGNLRPHSEKHVNKKFVYYLLGNLKKKIEDLAYGGAQPNISSTLIEALTINLPPLPEQNRIVEKLDVLFGQLELIKQSLNNIPQLLKDFRQQVLTQAVTGKLTEEWRVGKTLSEVNLLNDKHVIEFEIINYSEIPSGWINTALGNYANCSRGKFTARPRNDPKYFDGAYPFMQIGDLPRNGGSASNFSKTLNTEGVKVSKSFPENTVVIAIVGATIGITGILKKEMYFPDSLVGINCVNSVSNNYLEFYLRVCKEGYRQISYAGGGQPNIKLPTIRNLEFLIPPLEEQQEIVNRIESLFSKADAIEKHYDALKEKIDNLPQTILHKAFKGELVPQLTSDGDARELLEEIKKIKKTIKSKK